MKSKNKLEWIMSAVFIIVGLAFMAANIYYYIDTQRFKENAVETEAVIARIETYRDSDGDKQHVVYVDYTVDGETYGGELGYYSSTMYIGKNVTVYYDPHNPWNFRGKSHSIFSIAFFILGLIFFLPGGGLFLQTLRKKKRANTLLETGRRVDAKIDGVRLNRNFTMNGRHPYVLDLSYYDPTTGKVYTFVSENIWFNVESILQYAPITTLSVYMDEQNPKKYHVDLMPFKAFMGN